MAFSPEREDPGNTTVARRDIPKVVGGLDAQALGAGGRAVRSDLQSAVRVSSPAAAEMTKLLENIYRCVNIALVNELKLLSLRMGIDIWEVIEAASTKPFGFQPFYPGPGPGRTLHSRRSFLSVLEGEGVGLPHPLHRAGWRDQHRHAVPRAGSRGQGAESAKKALNGAKVLVLGVAYKKDIDDLRESPSLTIIELLQKAGRRGQLQRSILPDRGKRPQIRSADEMHAAGKSGPVRLRADRHRSLRLRLPRIVRESQLVVDTRNATRGIPSPKIVHC